MNKLLIALDIDGTVLNHDGHTPSEGIVAQLARLVREHYLVFASGRSTGDTLPVLESLGLTQGAMPQFIICCNGAVTLKMENNEYVRHRVISFDASRTLEYIINTLPGVELAVERCDGVYMHTSNFPLDYLHDKRILSSVSEIVHTPPARVVVYEASIDASEIAKRFESKCINFNNAWGYWDIMPPGVNKSTGLSFVQQSLCVSGDMVVSAGDGFNDIEMLEWTKSIGGRSFAMGQAPARVKQAALKVIGTVYDGGLAKELAKL
ncbi:MAG: HAD family hydrolase [Tropheryma whipplei]|uniref:HAD family hydrolase n=1 Tax=Tropheryma whipplei TaxID=2039 RepID=UPI0004B731DE|nr:HAD family hydrolase [Tropheryma whipplei]MCO8182461.1 HAD family hydrolase [Tropheryma whipplei]